MTGKIISLSQYQLMAIVTMITLLWKGMLSRNKTFIVQLRNATDLVKFLPHFLFFWNQNSMNFICEETGCKQEIMYLIVAYVNMWRGRLR